MTLAFLSPARLAQAFARLLHQGVAPNKLAWSLALGAWLGTIPVLGVSTLLCAVVAPLLRLNMLVMQSANYAVYPVQLLAVIPLFHLGARLFGAEPLDGAALSELLRDAGWDLMSRLGYAWVHALAAWSLLGAPATLLLALLARLLLGRWARNRKLTGAGVQEGTGP